MIRFIVALCFCLVAHLAAGQSIVWEKRIGWLFDDALTDVMELDSNSFLAIGSSEYFNAITHPSGETLTLLKLDSQGDTIWFRHLPFLARGGFLLRGDDVSYNYILCSTDTSTKKVHLLKVNQDGYLIEDVALYGTSGLSVTHALRTSSGFILASGIWFAGIGSPNLDDMAVLKIEPTFGFVYFVNRYSDHRITYGCWIEETPRHTYLASGTAGSRIWALELDSNGVEIRRTTFYQSNSRTIYNDAWVKQAPGGRYIVTGVLAGSGRLYYHGSYSRFDSSSRLWGGEQLNYCLPPHINDDGSMILYHGTNRLLLTRFREDSSVIWEENISSQIGNPNTLFINSLAYLSDSSAIGVGKVNFPSSAQSEYYLCRIQNVGVPYNPGQPVAAKTRYKGLPALIAYPMPTQGLLTVHTRSRVPLHLTTITGQVLETVQPLLEGTTEMDLRTYPAGLYFLRQGSVVVRVVKN